METCEEALRKTREQLLQEVSALDFELFNRRIDPNTWSIAQVCQHLAITDNLFTKAILFGLEQKSPPKDEHIPISFVSDRSNRIQAPKISEPGSEPIRVSQIIQLLGESRQKMTDVLAQIDDKSVLKTAAVKHPFFGNLPLDQWVELLELHEQRHIEQIKELKAHKADL